MSFIDSRYTRRACVGKTIKDVRAVTGRTARIDFTDGTYLEVTRSIALITEGFMDSYTIKADAQIITVAYNSNGSVIPATMED